jgi:hypothetical protein
MVYAQLRVRFPDTLWVGSLSRQYPDAKITALSAVTTGDDVVTVIEIEDIELDAVREATRSDPEVVQFDVLANSSECLLLSYRIRSRLYRATERAGVPPLYPVEIRNGWATIELTVTEAKLRTLHDELESEGASVEIRQISSSGNSADGLTDRQQELLQAAYENGYYDSPRQCSAADLAERFGITPSTVSDILRRAERHAVSTVMGATDS